MGGGRRPVPGGGGGILQAFQDGPVVLGPPVVQRRELSLQVLRGQTTTCEHMREAGTVAAKRCGDLPWLTLRGKRGFATPTEASGHRGALCFVVKAWALRKTTETVLSNGWRLAVGGWRLVAVGGWRLAVGGWRLVGVGGGWRLGTTAVGEISCGDNLGTPPILVRGHEKRETSTPPQLSKSCGLVLPSDKAHKRPRQRPPSHSQASKTNGRDERTD